MKINANYITQGDCLSLMKQQIPNECIDLTVTSPPYDNLRNYNGFEWDFKGVAKELFRVTKQGGVVAWIVGDATIDGSETGTSFKQALYFMERGFNLHDTMIWKKDGFSFPDKTRYRHAFEYMFILSKGTPKTINLIGDRKNKWAGCHVHGTSRGKNGEMFRKSNHGKSVVLDYGVRFNVWDVPTEKNNKTNHPAPFPEQLAADHILSWTNEGDIVFDPFLGSGTTAKMAILNNRNYLGFEISGEYIETAQRRIDEAKEKIPYEKADS